MTPETEVETEAAPQPWVKPTIERIPLNAAQDGATSKANDGTAGSS